MSDLSITGPLEVNGTSLLESHEHLKDLAEIRERKELAVEAYGQMDTLFNSFSSLRTVKKFVSGPRWEEDNENYYTETTPFFETPKGDRIAVQKYYGVAKRWNGEPGLLGFLHLRGQWEKVEWVKHYALVLDAGKGETREYARAGRDEYIGYAADRPNHDIVNREAKATLTEDNAVVSLVKRMENARDAGRLALVAPADT